MTLIIISLAISTPPKPNVGLAPKNPQTSGGKSTPFAWVSKKRISFSATLANYIYYELGED